MFIYLQCYFVDNLVSFQQLHKEELLVNREERYDHAISTFHALRNESSKISVLLTYDKVFINSVNAVIAV